MKLGQKRFLEDYGGRVFVTNLTKGCPPPHVEAEIIIEIERLIELEHGNLCDE